MKQNDMEFNVGDEVIVFLTEDENEKGHQAIVTNKVIRAEDNIDYDVEIVNEVWVGTRIRTAAARGAEAVAMAFRKDAQQKDPEGYRKQYQKEYRRRNKGKIKAYNKKRSMMNNSVEMKFPALLERTMKELDTKNHMKQVHDVIKLLKDSMKRAIPVMTNVPAIVNKLTDANKALESEHIVAALKVLEKFEDTGKPSNIQEEMLKHLMLVMSQK